MLTLDVPTPPELLGCVRKKKKSQSLQHACICIVNQCSRCFLWGEHTKHPVCSFITVWVHSLDAITFSTRSITSTHTHIHLRIDAPQFPLLMWAHSNALLTRNNTQTRHLHARMFHARCEGSTDVFACVLQGASLFCATMVASQMFFIVASHASFPSHFYWWDVDKFPGVEWISQQGLCDICSVLCLFILLLPFPFVLSLTGAFIRFAARQGCFYHWCTVNCDRTLIMQTSLKFYWGGLQLQYYSIALLFSYSALCSTLAEPLKSEEK